ncbi:MAG: oligosaccharide flippase family protein [Clostridia bacterium]|nr:oligosaccharide flippase family protein [Clostridia bacterium]
MMKSNKLKINSIISIISQVVTLVCGFLLPRAIIASYGSEVNGLITSISQFLGIIGLLDLGVGAVFQAAYYRPLSNNDYRTTSLIFFDSKRFFRKIAYVLIAYVLIVVAIIWGLNSNDFSFYYISSLIVCIALNFFTQYFFAAPYNLLLNADQKYYLTASIHIFLTILNVVVSLILIHCNAPIQIVKLASSIIFLIQPIIVIIYVFKKYTLIKQIEGAKYHLDQKWNGVAQHVATIIMNNADVVVLSLFTNLITVSIYSVTNIVINGLKSLISSFTNSYIPFFGDLYAKGDLNSLKKHFDFFEWLIHLISILFCSLAGVLILSFISNYTRNINDANYIQPLFSILMVCGLFVYCIRIPYNSIICGAGHFKQTQTSAIVEALINIVVSVSLVFAFGLVGVAIGTLVAIIYRTGYFVYYLNKNIINRRVRPFIKNILIDLIECLFIVTIGVFFVNKMSPESSYFSWFITAIIIGSISLVLVVVINLIFYNSFMKELFYGFIKKRKRGEAS